MSLLRYAVVVEHSEAGYGAYVPDLPGCIAVGTTAEEALELIQHTVELHLEALRTEGKPVPSPRSAVQYVEIRASNQAPGSDEATACEPVPLPAPAG